MNTDIRAGRLTSPFCAMSNIADQVESAALGADIHAVMQDYPLHEKSPFEGVSTISGGVWKASELCGDDAEDALLKLRFGAGTTDLPLHSHDHSDRVIIVAHGSGDFRFLSTGDSVCDLAATRVEHGDILVFARGTVHTFATQDEELALLSYHSPFIDIDDPRQYTVVGKRQNGK